MAARKMARAGHILSYAQTLQGGGVERVLLRLGRGWVEAGRRVTLVIGVPEGPLAAELPPGIEVIALGSPAYRSLATSLPDRVRMLAPDVLFCAGSHYTGAALWTRMRLGRSAPPIVGKVSNALDRADHGIAARLAHRSWLRLHPLFLDRIVAMTPASAVLAAQATGIPAERLAVIPNPPTVPIPGAASVALPAGRFLLGVGRLAPQKRWDRLIAALPRLRDTAVPLVIVGEGVLRRDLLAQAAALGVAHRLHLPGHAADPLPAMAQAAVVTLTSDFEGAPNVLREALSMGAPVVTTDSAPAIAEIVHDPTLGTIVPRDDPDALVAALDRWLTPDAQRPAPQVPPGADSAQRYLDLFDSVVRSA
ncbi:glycosyltransferase [Sphingomonas sp.]|jgi:glycosyltransferase involved in cell wall biosynthesis|uniref:glycosyltransferase n=1 Tax=Sphingomonas sp. TaxID=28214 RepID=UPI0035C866B6